MIKKWTTMLLCLIAVVSFSACSSNNQGNGSAIIQEESSVPAINSEPAATSEEMKLKVSVSFDAMKELVAAVGKDKVEISTIIPAGTEAHDFEPKAQDLVNLSTAQIFVYNGLGMEGWAEDAISAADKTDLIVVEASKGADIIERETTDEADEEHEEHADEEHADDEHADDEHADDEHADEEHADEEHADEEHADEEHADEEHDEHHHGKYDPHLWLSLKGAQTEAKNIKDAFVQADPSNKDYYEQNCNEFVAQLENLYDDYNEKFQSVEKNSFVTGHAAFGYLCRDFGLEQNSVKDIFAEGEPSAQQLAELVEYCRENNVTTIFAEEMVSTEVSQTLANEVGAKVEIIYTIENAQDDMTYLERMESNLSKIYASLTE